MANSLLCWPVPPQAETIARTISSPGSESPPSAVQMVDGANRRLQFLDMIR